MDIGKSLLKEYPKSKNKQSSAARILARVAKINLIISYIAFIPVWIISFGLVKGMFYLNDTSTTQLSIFISLICAILFLLINIVIWALFKTIANISITLTEINKKTNSSVSL